MTRAVVFLILALFLTSCAPATAESTAVANAAPEAVAAGQTELLNSLTKFMDAEAQRVAVLMQAQQPNYSPIFWGLVVFGLLTSSGLIAAAYFRSIGKAAQVQAVQPTAQQTGITRVEHHYHAILVWRTPQGDIRMRDNSGEKTLTEQEYYILMQGIGQNEQLQTVRRNR